jgi:hypothetical protein
VPPPPPSMRASVAQPNGISNANNFANNHASSTYNNHRASILPSGISVSAQFVQRKFITITPI